MFCGRDGLSSALSRNIDDEDTQWEPSPINGACASVRQYTSSMSPMDNEDQKNEGVNIPERNTVLQSLDSRLDEVARGMAVDTRRSERTSSGALLNGNMLEDLVSPADERESDCESGSHKNDSSSSGHSDVDDFQGYLGDECQGCNAGTPEDLSVADANYDESGVPEDERRDIPWLSELCREVYEGVGAKVIDGGDIKLTR